QREKLLDTHLDRLLHEALEAGMLEFKPVAPRRQSSERVDTGLVARLPADFVRVEVRQREDSIRNDGSGGIGHRPADVTSKSLRRRKRCERGKGKQTCGQT